MYNVIRQSHCLPLSPGRAANCAISWVQVHPL